MAASHTLLLLVLGSSLSQLELAGVSVTPHVATPGIKYQAGDPPAPRGAVVRLFVRNAGEQPVTLREAMFDRQSPLSLVPNGDWSWADVPSTWTGERLTLPPAALTVLSFNGTSGRWPVGRRFPLLIETDEPPGGRFELAVNSTPSKVRLSAVTFLPAEEQGRSERLVIHVTNDSKQPVRVSRARLWEPSSNPTYRVLYASKTLENLEHHGLADPDNDKHNDHHVIIPSGESGAVVARLEKKPLSSYLALEVEVTDSQDAETTLWAHLRHKVESFDISGGWVDGEAADGSRTVTKEPFLKTLKRLHINTAHLSETPGYTDQTGPGGLYTRYPLKFFHFLDPLEAWDTDTRLPLIHAAERLGEPQYGGWTRGRMHPQEVFFRLKLYARSRIASTVTLSDPSTWHEYAGLSDYPHFDAYRVTAPAPDSFRDYDRWGPENRIGWAAPLETVGAMTRSLRDMTRPAPVAAWAQGPHHGWTGRDGRKRGSPTPEEIRVQAYHQLASRVTSLYWFNLSLASLLKYPDTLDELTRIGRECRTLEELYLEGDAYRYERMTKNDGRPDWDLSSIMGPSAGLLFAVDLDYAPDPAEKVFRFGSPRPSQFHFELPAYLRPAAALARVDAGSVQPIEFENTAQGLRFEDRISQVGIYVVTREAGLPASLERKRQALMEQERALHFDPARVPADRETLRALLPAKGR